MSDRATIIAFENWVSTDDLTHGLDWVRWLLRSVRARCQHIVFQGDITSRVHLLRTWEKFTRHTFLPAIGPQIIRAWQAATERDVTALIEADTSLSALLSPAETGSSRRAGALLMHTTCGAKFQGLLGHYRIEWEASRTPGHLATTWAAAGVLFQLSLVNVLAEYLRIEWETATRDTPHTAPPHGTHSFAALTSLALRTQNQPALRLVRHA